MLAFCAAPGKSDSLTQHDDFLCKKKRNFLFQFNFEARWKTTAWPQRCEIFRTPSQQALTRAELEGCSGINQKGFTLSLEQGREKNSIDVQIWGWGGS